MRKLTSLIVLCLITTTAIFAQLNVSLVGQIDYDPVELNDIWGYVDPVNNVEYALVGLRTGVSVVSLADPANPVEVDFVAGDFSVWRDIKTWGSYAYVTADQGNDGLTVLDLSYLPDSVPSTNWNPIIDVNGTLTTLNKAHNIWVDENGFAFITGANVGVGGVMIVDVNTTPGSPNFLSLVNTRYSHDCYVRGDTLWTAEIYAGEFGVYDVTNKATPVQMATFPTPGAFTHNLWLSNDGMTLFTTDEKADAPVASFDVSQLNAIQQLDEFRPTATLGTGVIPHNVHIWQDWVVTSYYTDGIILIDGSRPDNMVEVGNFDTWLPGTTGFDGIWGAYPFLPSGLVLCSDMTNGLYVFQPNYVRACWLEGNVTDAVSGLPINAAQVSLQTTTIQTDSDVFGTYKTGTAVAGTYTVLVQAQGYQSKTISVTLANGQLTIEDIQLVPAVPFNLVGKVVDAATNQPIPDAPIIIENLFTSNTISSDANGEFSIASMPTDNYNVIAGIWGYKTKLIADSLLSTNTIQLTIPLEIGYEDPFALDLGWTILNNAQVGAWERARPIKVVDPTVGQSTPEFDNPTDVGTQCYVTANGGTLVGERDVDNGSTTLISPIFDVATYINPHIKFDFWFFNEDLGGSTPNDTLRVRLTDGTQTVTAMNISMSNSGWFTRQIRIADYITPSSTMKVEFYIEDQPAGDIVEGAIDNFIVFDTFAVSTAPVDPLAATLKAFPNPFNRNFILDYDFDQWDNSPASLVIFNVLGQPVFRQPITQQAGQVSVGNTLANGIYFIQLEQNNQVSERLKVIKVK